MSPPRALPADVMDPRCPSRQVLDRVADRWTALVIRALGERTHRFGELRRHIGGVSQKMLTQTLRALEHDGLVARTVYAEVPPRVEYRLTPLGRSLRRPLDVLCSWAEDHIGEIRSARGRSSLRGVGSEKAS